MRSIYPLCAGSDPSAITGYPGQELFGDLSSIAVSLSDVFQGNGPWTNIPRVTLNLPC